MADAKDTPPSPPANPTTGKGTPAQRWPKLPADHPLFKRGYVTGIRRLADFSPSTRAASPAPQTQVSPPEKSLKGS